MKHFVSLNFVVASDNEEPTAEELLKALKDKAGEVDLGNVKEKLEVYDSEE